MIDIRNALSFICELARMVKRGPTTGLAFVDAARWTATAFVVRSEYGYRSTWRPDEHIRLNGVHVSEVIRSVDAALRRLKRLPRAIRLNGAASILNGDRPLSYDVVDISGMIMPRTRGFADRRLEGPGRQGGRALPQSNVVARAGEQFERY
jgi:hypothetical protein